MIENELKFVLQPTLVEQMQKYAVLKPQHRTHIVQCYYNRDGRFRAQTDSFGRIAYTFTYKVPLPNGEMEEFEQIIDATTFERIRPLCQEVLIKDRYSVRIKDVMWDIDFFKNQDGTVYWIMAEAEMKAGLLEVPKLPPVITDHLLYAVPRDRSSAFSSRKLADPSYADKLRLEFQSPAT